MLYYVPPATILLQFKLTLGEELLRQVSDRDCNEEVQDHDQISEGEPLSSVAVVSLKCGMLMRK